eukprot:scaffold18758_cov31-Tisochrysis_lutea.AAC.3
MHKASRQGWVSYRSGSGGMHTSPLSVRERHLVPRRKHDLHKDVTITVFGIVGQQILPGQQLQLHALKSIKVVNACKHARLAARLSQSERFAHGRELRGSARVERL